MANYLITGGAGFIGSHLVQALVADGHHVRVLDDFKTGNRHNLDGIHDRVEIVTGSVTNAGAMQLAVRDVQTVFHLAALPSVQRSIEDPETTHEVCATGTLGVLQAARKAGCQRVVYAASSSAYGDAVGAVRREDEPVAPLSPYAVAKLAGEHYCRSFTRSYGLPTVRLRFFNIFGPRQDPESPYAGVIPRFIAAMSAGQAPTVYGTGEQARDFTYVANAVQALRKASDAAAAVGNVYNVGSGGCISILDLVQQLNRLLGTRLQPTFGPARAGEVWHSQADISQARRDLGYEPSVPFEEGLRLTLEAYRAALR